MKRDKKILIVLLLIILAGLFVRLKGIVAGYFAFTFDQGRDMLAVRDLVKEGKLSLIGPTTGLPGIFYGPWWYWFMVPAFVISAGDPKAAVIAVSLVNTLMIPLGYFLGKSIGDRSIGLILALLIAFIHPFIAHSVQLWSPNLVPFFALFSLFVLWQYINTRRWYYLLLLGVSSGFVFEFELAFGVFFTIAIAFFLAVAKVKIGKKLKWRFLIAAFLGFLLILLPRIIFDFRHDFLISRSIFRYLNKPVVYQSSSSIAERFVSRSNLFLSLFSKTLASENRFLALLIAGVMFWFMAMLFFNRKVVPSVKLFAAWLLVLLMIFFIGFILYPDAVWDYYLIGLPLIYLLLLAVVLVQIRKTNSFLFLIFFVLIAVSSIKLSNLIDYYNSQWTGDYSVYKNQKDVLDFIYTEAQGKPFSVVVYTPALIDYPYQYLFSWYGKKQYGYEPLEGKKTVFYILEPGNESLRQHWLNQRKDDGQVIKERTMTGGIIVQRRIRNDKENGKEEL